ncbi:MAG: hypothetical protein IPH33_13130 [Bacteroidetes bacterium]|nr:hypothetical protein [Bacteroidota bacterium]
MCFFSVLCAVMLIAGSSYGQSKKELEKKKNAIQKDIEYTNQLLKQTKKNKSASLNQLVTLNKKLRTGLSLSQRSIQRSIQWTMKLAQ